MDAQKRRELQEKTRKIIENSVNFIKKGLVRIELVAEKTVETGKLHYQHNKLKSHLQELFEQLGKSTYQQANKHQSMDLPLTIELQGLLTQIRETEEQISALHHEIQRVSVTQSQLPEERLKSRL